MKVLKFIIGVFVWSALGLPGLSYYSSRNHNKEVYVGDLALVVVLGPIFSIVNGFVYVIHDDKCVLHCGDK